MERRAAGRDIKVSGGDAEGRVEIRRLLQCETLEESSDGRAQCDVPFAVRLKSLGIMRHILERELRLV